MQIVDDGTAAEVKEVLATAAVAGTASLPPPNVGQGMLDWYPFPQLGTALGRQLPLP